MHIGGPGRAADAAAAITGRRKSAGDAHLDALTDEAFGVVDYVCTHRGVPAPVLAADALDALVIVRTLRQRLDRQELALIGIARDAGATWSDLALPLGLRSRQAAEQRKLRLEAQHGGDRRSELVARVRHRQADNEGTWLTRHLTEILALALSVSRSLDDDPSLPQDVQDATELLRDALGEAVPSSRELMACLSLLLAAARQSTGTSTIGGLEKVKALVAAWDRTRPT